MTVINTSQHVKGTITIASESTLYSDIVNMSKADFAAFSLTWSNLSSFNARAILQGSCDSVNWGDLGGTEEGIILDVEDDTQIWLIDFTKIPFLRLELTTNNLSSGTIQWEFTAYA